jgi:predicted Fe-Mo cluster-binding NifX family protein
MPQPADAPTFRVAVASLDAKYVHLHFGRTPEFQIFDVEGPRLRFVETRRVPPLCEGGEHNLGSLIRVISKLRDCKAVLAAQIGPDVQRALAANHIFPYALPDTIPSAVNKLRATGFPDMDEGGPRGRDAPSHSTHASHPLVLPHVVPGRSPVTTSDLVPDVLP